MRAREPAIDSTELGLGALVWAKAIEPPPCDWVDATGEDPMTPS
jgi:hypothetical protein